MQTITIMVASKAFFENKDTNALAKKQAPNCKVFCSADAFPELFLKGCKAWVTTMGYVAPLVKAMRQNGINNSVNVGTVNTAIRSKATILMEYVINRYGNIRLPSTRLLINR